MKKLMFFAATAAVALSSCSKTDIVAGAYDGVENNPYAIGFMTNTTKAAVNTVTEVAAGFQIFGHAANGTAWYNDGATATTIDGTFDYYKPTTLGGVTDNNGWQWRAADGSASVEAPLWPTAQAAYPMSFYAAFPTDQVATPADYATDPTSLVSTITANADRFSQVDHLAAFASPAAMPSGGKLALVFKHILSKVNVAVTPATDYTVEVQSVNFVNIVSSGSYNYNNDAHATGNGWTLASTKAPFLYRDAVFAGSTAAAADAYRTAISLSAYGTVRQDDAVAADNGHLMLHPQTYAGATLVTTGVDATEGAANLAAIQAGGYIEVLYRVVWRGTTTDVVGREDITDVSETNPYYNEDGSVAASSWTDAVTDLLGGNANYAGTNGDDYVDGGAITAGQHLYIKALFPLKSTIDVDGTATTFGTDWAKGNGYIYNLLIGSAGSGAGEGGNGGYFADNSYYDEAGNDTGLNHQGQPGSPVFAEERIHFDVTVTEWDEQGNIDLQ